jgi:hypothetical protein
MAQATALKTYDVVGNHEDLTDIISVITRKETPLFSALERTKAKSSYHETQVDTLSTGSDNAQIEGADYTFAVPAATTRQGSYTQIFSKTIKVSKTQVAGMDHAGAANEFDYQTEKRMKEIATDVEKALITGTGNSGASGTARRLKGILAYITTNVTTGTGTGNEALTETMYNDTLALIWAAGGRPDRTLVNGSQKRKISSFATSNTRYLEMDESAKLINKVSIYESDFGVQRIELDPFMDTDKVAILQTDLWRVAVLRPIEFNDVPSIGSYKAGVIEGELTLESQNQAGSGKITELS